MDIFLKLTIISIIAFILAFFSSGLEGIINERKITKWSLANGIALIASFLLTFVFFIYV